jgi:hypothetical protein
LPVSGGIFASLKPPLRLAPNFQIIVLEHANLPDERYQEAMIEAPWSGIGHHALVPEEWK